ncbi:MAG TPA: MFS transporter [Pilimelia sp.]|nr:MFS transporter [Pilimelia sp.]
MTEIVAATGPAGSPSRGGRPRRGSPAAAAIGAATTTIACVLPVFLVGGLAVQMGDELRFSPAGLGLAVAVYFGVSAVASVPAGKLVERYGPRLIARIAIALAAACLLAIASLARSFPALVVPLAVSAVANALGQLASNAALAQRVPIRRQGLSFGIKQAAIPLSTLLAGAAVPTVALTAGWRWAFVLAAVLAVAAIPLVPPSGGPPGRDAAGTGQPGDAAPDSSAPDGRDRPGRPGEGGRRAQPGGGRRSWLDGGGRRASERRRDRATAALVVIGVAAMLAGGAANALGTFLVDASVGRGLDPGLAGLTLTFGSVVCVTARLLGGWLADHRDGGHVVVIAGLLVCGAVGLGLLALPGPAALLVGVALGFGLGWSWPGLMNFAVVRLHPQAPAAATSITQTGVYAGGCLGPLALGAVAAHAGYPAMWTVAAIAMLAAAGCMLLGSHMLHRQQQDPLNSSIVGASTRPGHPDS